MRSALSYQLALAAATPAWSPASAAAEIGSALGEEAAERTPPNGELDDLLSVVGEVLDGHGYEPRREDDSLILANCPFHALAKDYTDLVCGMNLDIMRGLVACLPADGLEARLDPAPDRCCVRIIER